MAREQEKDATGVGEASGLQVRRASSCCVRTRIQIVFSCDVQAVHTLLKDAAATARTLSEFGVKEAQQERLGQACRSILASSEARPNGQLFI